MKRKVNHNNQNKLDDMNGTNYMDTSAKILDTSALDKTRHDSSLLDIEVPIKEVTTQKNQKSSKVNLSRQIQPEIAQEGEEKRKKRKNKPNKERKYCV